VRALLRRIERVEQILAADRAGADAALTYGPLRLDPEAYRATLDGDPLDLTRTEFELLHLLLRNPGRAFSRSYLLDTVWGETYITGDRSVDNAILRLRRKLGALGEAIETVWGVGYRLRKEA
jgi:DNA-binding response OmpR family regulator